MELNEQALAGFDCAVVVTDHSAYDFEKIVAQCQLVVDTRNATHGVRCAGTKVVRC